MNVIVTGSSKGIGKAVAAAFAAEGHHLFLCARNENELQRTASDLEKLFPASVIHYKAADLSLLTNIVAFADFCLQYGSPDILVNNAGVYFPGGCLDDKDELEPMLKANLYSAYYLTRRIAPEMIKRKSGHIFNVSSIAALAAYDGGGCYSISKFAMNGFSQNLRHELKPHNIKVTTIFPGAVFTDSWKGFDNTGGRIMEASDIAKMIVACSKLSLQAVVEEIVLRPQLGDL